MNLKRKNKVIAILVDGLGAEQIMERSGHAPWLNGQLSKSNITHCGFPATTSANIASFATGVTPGEHGLVGHRVWDRNFDEQINLLIGWNERTDPSVWQPIPTVSERSASLGIQCNVIAAGEYQNTPYTQATMRGANFIPADSWEERFEQARIVSSSKESSLTYLYIPELDKYGHKNGWTSPGWAVMLEELDAALRSFCTKLPADTGVIITADHGMMETSQSRQLVLDEAFEKSGSVNYVGGDTRVNYVYLDDPTSLEQVVADLQPFSYAFDSVSTNDAIAAGWFGKVLQPALDRLPELMLVAKSDFTLYHSKYFKARSFQMIAHHGSISSAETRVPLLRIGF
ncbi:MAG: alkaline phosphatase family protein [Aquiluna sp.]|nr:alkaline phosphatase family protein [Aquiluna sp.]